jgi:hypothetical protein
MLLARSVGSMGMALPAFLGSRGLANRSAGHERTPTVPSGPTGRRQLAGSIRARARSLRCHRPGGHEANRDYADTVRPSSPSSNRLPAADRLRLVPLATQPVQPRAGNRCDRARRGGQVGPIPAGLHPSPEAASTPSTQGSDDQSSGGDLQAALGIGAGCLASTRMRCDGSCLAMDRVEFCATGPQPRVLPRGLRW